MLKAEVLYKQNIASTPLALAAGPSFGIMLHGTQTERLTLLDEGARFPDGMEDVRYENNNRTAVKSGDIPELHSFMVSLKGGVLYELRIKRWLVLPHIFFEYPFTSLSGETGWNISVVQIGLQLQFAM